MTTEAGNRSLLEKYLEVSEEMKRLRESYEPGEVSHAQHYDYAEWAGQFISYTDAAIALLNADFETQSYCLVRSALEQWAMDAVVFVGDRFVRHILEVPEDAYEDLLERWRLGELPHIVEEPVLRRSTMILVIRGLTADDDRDTVIHPLYFWADRYNPFVGPPEEQEHLADWLDRESAIALAEDQRRQRWPFRWGPLLDSLVLNGIVDERHRIHLNVHYRFLSAFVHSYKATHRMIERRSAHAVTELLLLYVTRFAANYLDSFIQMTLRAPPLELANRDRLRQLISEAREITDHLWFLDDRPTLFDRGQELGVRLVNTRDWENRGRPEDLDVEEIRYYPEPLDRLDRMHESFIEGATGFVYRPPWE